MKLEKTKPRVLVMPAEMWYYATLPRESDAEKMWTSTEYGILRSHEPMMYRMSYEEYVDGYNRRTENKTEYNYMLRAAAVTRDTVDTTADAIEALEDFVGWVSK